MDYETFVNNIKAIVNISDKHNDGWKLITTSENILFITKAIYRSTHDISNDQQIEDDSNIQQFESNSINDCISVTIKWEYNIIYSESYRVPVCYFNSWKCNGSVLLLEEIWDTLNCKHLSIDLYSMITQTEHPINGMPYFQLHPCKTSEIIKSFQESSHNLVVSWISSISNYIHLDFEHQIYYNSAKPGVARAKIHRIFNGI
ncbi:ubiquitin-like-conjugating enzyme ATG10 [Chrysoperla carnea]|uniref:ubiquitin-like-conjugating enzyme ATG10 n=1 Tax=Chrysoperla carnea TaxID=189513 RepID=UPI001D071E92|nr:ubiquitin-like-conjugating enzyme ATG10 [Chrysoperla carnea]